MNSAKGSAEKRLLDVANNPNRTKRTVESNKSYDHVEQIYQVTLLFVLLNLLVAGVKA